MILHYLIALTCLSKFSSLDNLQAPCINQLPLNEYIMLFQCVHSPWDPVVSDHCADVDLFIDLILHPLTLCTVQTMLL